MADDRVDPDPDADTDSRARGGGEPRGEPAGGRSGIGSPNGRRLRDRARDVGDTALYVPPALETTVTRLESGDFVVDASIEDDRNVVRRTVRQVVLGGLLAANLLVVSVLYAVVGPLAAGVAALAFLPLAVLLRWSFGKSRNVGPPVQFTRHELRSGPDRSVASDRPATDREQSN